MKGGCSVVFSATRCLCSILFRLCPCLNVVLGLLFAGFPIPIDTLGAVLRLRGSICHMRGFIFTNARKIYYHLRVSIARFLITFIGNLDV